jgi:NAD(P)-dependent dehydrogenase (short-subunit alcohol dehydrogenase family)
MSHDGRVVLITGGSSGIGLATAGAFRDAGASVVLVARDVPRLEKARAELAGRTAQGSIVDVIGADVSKPGEVDRVVDQVLAEHGRLDVVFANAGTLAAPPLLDTDESAFDLVMDTNVKSVFFLAIRAVPRMTPGGSVVVTSSAAATKGRPAGALYSASKAAVRSLVRTLALDPAVLERGIRVNAVTPGLIATPMMSYEDAGIHAALDEYVTSTVPMGRWGQAEDVARSVLFLASPDASYITGTEIQVDGGFAQL